MPYTQRTRASLCRGGIPGAQACFFKSARARSGDSILVPDTDGVLNIDGADAGRTGRDTGKTGRKHFTVFSRFDSVSPLSVPEKKMLNSRRCILEKIRMIMNSSVILGIKYHDFMDELSGQSSVSTPILFLFVFH